MAILRHPLRSPRLSWRSRGLMYQVTPRRAALIVEHMQNDVIHQAGAFCQSDYRHLIPRINSLLAHPSFILRIATKATPPPDHIVMAHNHPGKKPGHHIDYHCPVKRDSKPPIKQQLMPKYLQEGTWGHQFVDGFDTSKIDIVYEKLKHVDVVKYAHINLYPRLAFN
jgi:nicotinamidase-related amidase